jgi:beta-lactamase regulating signal transducer with metallopeptidase domain
MIVCLATRLFWFNPFAFVLRRHAILAIEAGCDETCARLLGRQQYRNTLARLVLHSHKRQRFALAPMLHSTSIDFSRIALLEGRSRMDVRAWGGVCLILLACAVGAQLAAQPPAGSASEMRERMGDASHYGYDVPPIWRLRTEVDR